LVSAAVEATEELNNTAISERPKEKVRRKKSQSPDSIPKVEPNPVSRPAVSSRAPPEEVSESSPEPERPSDRDTKLERTNAEIAALKASMKRNVDVAPEKSAKPKSALEALIPASSTRGRKRGKVTDEKGAMDMFKAFKQRLDGLPTLDPEPDDEDEKPTPEPSTAEPDAGGNDDEEAALCDLHFIANCESCRSWDEITKGGGDADEDGEGDPDWMAHTLSFAKDTLGKDLEWKRKMEEIEVIDPREKARAIKDERRKGKERDGATRKDGGKMKV
jgi:peptidyl-prolyl cis-trans isomerase SDCCAG10